MNIGICKVLCSREGILIDNITINKSLLTVWLECLTDVDWSENTIYSLINPKSSINDRIHALLSLKDTQDVPRAIKLLSLAADIRNLDRSNLDPSTSITHLALSLLGEMLDALVEPFINPNLSISEQITSLVKFAHLACTLFLKHKNNFMPQYLYSDLQCMVQTAIFHVAHTKLLDPEHKVFICLLGDDVLEVLFGWVRMIGGHSLNVEVDELHNWIGAALQLDEIFQEYPTWERHPHHLKLKHSCNVDHLSPWNWQGELCAITCDLLTCWEEGVCQAAFILTRFGYNMNFKEFFCDGHKLSMDLMHPRGGRYPGISSEVDQSLGEAAEGEDIEEDYSFQLFDGHAAYDAKMEVQQQAGLHSIWMDLEDRKHGHKKTILCLFMDPALDLDYNKSHD